MKSNVQHTTASYKNKSAWLCSCLNAIMNLNDNCSLPSVIASPTVRNDERRAILLKTVFIQKTSRCIKQLFSRLCPLIKLAAMMFVLCISEGCILKAIDQPKARPNSAPAASTASVAEIHPGVRSSTSPTNNIQSITLSKNELPPNFQSLVTDGTGLTVNYTTNSDGNIIVTGINGASSEICSGCTDQLLVNSGVLSNAATLIENGSLLPGQIVNSCN